MDKSKEPSASQPRDIPRRPKKPRVFQALPEGMRIFAWRALMKEIKSKNGDKPGVVNDTDDEQASQAPAVYGRLR